MEREYPVPDLTDYYVTESGLVISRKHGKQIKSFNDFTIALSGTNEALILPIFGIFHRSNGLNFGDSIFQGCAYR